MPLEDTDSIGSSKITSKRKSKLKAPKAPKNLKRPEKPKKPRLIKKPAPCGCFKGKMKDWGSYGGPYPEYDWVVCSRCNGTEIVSVERQNKEEQDYYDNLLKSFQYKLAIYNILKTIRITKEQLEAIQWYGVSKFADHLS